MIKTRTLNFFEVPGAERLAYLALVFFCSVVATC